MKKETYKMLKSIPWVTELEKPYPPCDAIRWSEVPLKARYPHGKNRLLPPTGIEPYKCKHTARWKFTGLTDSLFGDKSGNYCYNHLIYRGLHGDMEETGRTEDFLAGLENK